MVVHASEASQQLAPLSISAQAQHALQQIEAWPHWHLVQQVAQREYQLSTDKMAILLPEYQRFLALIAVCPEGGIGMYSSSVDKLWHSHLLLTRKYRSFCQQMYGRFIDHEPNLPLIAESITLQDCEVPDTPPAQCVPETPPAECVDDPCSYDDDPRDSEDSLGQCSHHIHDFVELYLVAFGVSPSAVWNVQRADAVTA